MVMANERRGRDEGILPMNRARFLRMLAAVPLLWRAPVAGSAPSPPRKSMHTRPIPASGEALPVIGCGTYVGFDVALDAASRARLAAVLAAMRETGGTVIDSSPMYGRAEDAVGTLVEGAAARRGVFLATKVWTEGRDAGIRQMEASFAKLRTTTIDLMQVHNLVDWRTHLGTLRRWQAEGRVRYVGVTHYTSGAYRDLAAVMRAEKLDFVQVNYALDEPEAAARILPLAAERGMAVIVNRPFGGGGLLRRLAARPLPAWATDIDAATWAEVLLKFVLSHPAVTCAIPGTGDPRHMEANARAGAGIVPEPGFWGRHAAELAA
jgi:diketogulonate reductase-like aldo/keto reductase